LGFFLMIFISQKNPLEGGREGRKEVESRSISFETRRGKVFLLEEGGWGVGEKEEGEGEGGVGCWERGRRWRGEG